MPKTEPAPMAELLNAGQRAIKDLWDQSLPYRTQLLHYVESVVKREPPK